MRNSLGALLAFGLIGLQLIAVLAIVFLSYMTSERALLDHARALLRDVGINTIAHSTGFLSPARGAAELAARLAQNDIVASDNPRALEQLLFQQLQITPQFSGLYYGDEKGDFIYVMRSDGPGPFRSKFMTTEDGQRISRLIWRDDEFRVIAQETDLQDSYDPRNRPWYLRAQERMGTIWTDPYIFFSSQQPGITLAAPVRDGQGGIRGVIGVDIEISDISDFLAQLEIGATGKALVINRNGDVIAHPDPELIKTRDTDGTLRFTSISEIEDPIARAAFSAGMAERSLDSPEGRAFDVSYAGRRYVSLLIPMISDILPWTIAVYAPESDFTEVIKKNRRDNLWIAAFIAAATGLVGLALADTINKPVKAFAVRSALIAQGELDPSSPLPRTYKELALANEALVEQIVARKKTEREYGQTFDLSSRGMAQIDTQTGQFLRVNARLSAMTGYSAEQLCRKGLRDLIVPGPGPCFTTPEPFGEALNSYPEIWLTCQNGSTICAVMNAIVIRGQDGTPLHTVLTLDEITETKRKEAQIAQLNSDLGHLARGNMMGQMAAGLAHELNQPLTAIAQDADSAKLLVERLNDPDHSLQEILTGIEMQSHRAASIIRALRSFIRKDSGAQTSFDLAELFEQTQWLIQPEASRAGVKIRSDLGGLPPIFANRVQVAQVVINLLRNAIEACATSPAAGGNVDVSGQLIDGHVLVTVSDDGPGVPDNIRLFSEFETSKPEGMGLGLSICRTLVEVNGGKLWFVPDTSCGASFRFTLPLAPEG